MSIIKGTNQIVAGFGGTKRSIGEVYFSQSALATDNSGALPLFTGETIASANTIYPDFYNWVSAHTELQCTSAEYESALSTYGECPKYVIGNGSLRLPKLSNYIKAANTSEGITQKEAGLPNITGYASPRKDGYDGGGLAGGAFWLTSDTASAGHGATEFGPGTRINFDASRSSAVYGKSSTVTPAHTTLYPWVVAYTAAIPASEAQAAEFQQGLSGKADTNLGNTTPSKSFKEMSVGWGTINFDARVNFTLNPSTSYTVPKDGFVFITTSREKDQGSNVKINGVEVCGSTAYWTNLTYNFPVCAGMILSTNNNTLIRAIFCPLKGVN